MTRGSGNRIVSGMNRVHPSVLLAICLLALMGLSATATAQTPLQAEFESVPDAPEVGQQITFTDTTKSTTPITRAWDLDGDGKFTDGEKATQIITFSTPGDHDVALRVRRTGTSLQESIARKTITVKEATTPIETATPTPSPAPTVIHAPKINLPPVARIDKQCGPFGTTEICLGQFAKIAAPKTFDATQSTDGDGTIVRYEWDTDGNDAFETDTGADPHLTHTYNDENPVTLKLRVTDNEGATAVTELPITKLEASCQEHVHHKRMYVSGQCLRKYPIKHGFQYRSKHPVQVNGITLVPGAANKPIMVNILGGGLLKRAEIISGKAVASFPFKGENIVIQSGPLHWTRKNNRLENVQSLNGRKLNGLTITGAPEDGIDLPTRGVARTNAYLKLPAVFGGPTSDRPVTLTAGSPKTDLTGAVAEAADADDAFSFTVPAANLGVIQMDTLKVTYDGEGLWEIDANLTIPVIDARLEAQAGIYKGDFNYANAELSFPSPGLGPLGPIYLHRVKFGIEVNPKRSTCVPHIGVVTTQTPWGATTKDYGIPTFALCGEVGLSAGPKIIGGVSAISLDAGLSVATYGDERPSVFRSYGDMKVVSIPFAGAEFEAHTDGFVKVSGKFHYDFAGFASLDGHLDLGLLGKKFNAEGGVRGCLGFLEVEICRGINALISSKGMAACMVIDYWVDDWRPGFGYKWGDGGPTPYFSGCSLGPYRAKLGAHAAQADEHTFTLPGGLPGAAVAITGAEHAPKVTLVGPEGERLTMPDQNTLVEDTKFFALRVPQSKLTNIAINKPSAGTWKVIVEDGSTIADLKVANGIPKPKIDATVVGRGQDRRLRYDVKAQPGQKVTFIERGPSTAGEIGVASRRKGELNFVPAAGASERREIVALVEDADGFVSEQPVVTHYRAPKAFRPGATKGLNFSRGKLTWKPIPGATRYVVTAKTDDGRTLVRTAGGHSAQFEQDIHLRAVKVVGVSAAGLLGR
jgi:YD repeat-containing protein